MKYTVKIKENKEKGSIITLKKPIKKERFYCVIWEVIMFTNFMRRKYYEEMEE